MRMLIVATALLAAACSQPAEQQNAAGNEAVPVATGNVVRNEVEPAPAVEPAALPASEPAKAPAAAAPAEPYKAHGQEPGWALTIAGGQIDYQGNYGEKLIKAAAPEPKPIAGGRRYETGRLVVEIVTKRCNDAMSGQGFEDEVTVVADGETYKGCGGKRRTDWDM